MSYAILGKPPRFARALPMLVEDLGKARLEFQLGAPAVEDFDEADHEALGALLVIAAEMGRPFTALPSSPDVEAPFLAFVSYDPSIDGRGFPFDARACRVCGCVDEDCRLCVERTGQPCRWVEADLCSACAPLPRPEVSATDG